jgi:hypothetical protein
MNGRRIKRLDELSQAVPPVRDLWPAISAAIEADAGKVHAETSASRRSAWRPVSALAAALALVTLGVWIGRSMAPSMVPTQLASGGAAESLIAATPVAFERDEKYRKTRDALLVEAQNKLATMPAADREKVAASLATLRRSIAEIEAALGRDPANTLLQELLVNSCQEEMRALTAVRDSGSQEI